MHKWLKMYPLITQSLSIVIFFTIEEKKIECSLSHGKAFRLMSHGLTDLVIHTPTTLTYGMTCRSMELTKVQKFMKEVTYENSIQTDCQQYMS